jgi:hypothetical protein
LETAGTLFSEEVGEVEEGGVGVGGFEGFGGLGGVFEVVRRFLLSFAQD